MSFPHGWGIGPDFESSAAKLRQEQQEAAQMYPVSAPVPTLSHEAIRDLMYGMAPAIKQHVAEQIAAHHPPPFDPDAVRAEIASIAADNAALRSCIAVLNSRCDAAEATVATLRADIAAKALDRDEIVQLRERMAKIEGKGIPEYHGIWRADDVPYERGACVTFSGALWHCNRSSSQKPGDEGSGWTLCVKSGGDIAEKRISTLEREVRELTKPSAHSGTAEARR
jgi:hypothetical protein